MLTNGAFSVFLSYEEGINFFLMLFALVLFCFYVTMTIFPHSGRLYFDSNLFCVHTFRINPFTFIVLCTITNVSLLIHNQIS